MDSAPSLLSLRLLVPPVRLMTAYMWQVAHQQNVEHFGKLENFVSVVLKIVPDLLSHRQTATLIMGLRAKMLLEMCRGDVPVELQSIRSHLSEIQARHLNSSKHSELETLQSSLVELVMNLLEDPVGKEYFFKRVYPVEYGPDFDKALQVLVCYFISRLEKLLPIPNFKQVSSWVDSASLWKECEPYLCQPEHLHTLLQNTWNHGPLGETDLPSIVEDRIISSLSYQRIPGVCHRLSNLHRVPHLDLQRPSSQEPQEEDQETDGHVQRCRDIHATLSVVREVQKHPDPSSTNTIQGDPYDEDSAEFDLEIETGMEEATPNQTNVPLLELGRGKTTRKATESTMVPLEVLSLIPVDQCTEEKLTVAPQGENMNVSHPKEEDVHPALLQQKIVLVLSDISSTNNTKDDVNGAVIQVASHNAADSQCSSDSTQKASPSTTLTKSLASFQGGKKCPHCSRCFKYNSYLVRHLRSHVKDSTQHGRDLSSLAITKRKDTSCVQKYKCVTCGLRLGSWHKWRIHRKTHAADRPPQCVQKCVQKYKCVTCGLILASRQKWSSHRRTHAVERPPQKCVHCGREFKHRAGLRRHQRDPSQPTCLQPKPKRICADEKGKPKNVSANAPAKSDPGQCRFCGEIFPEAIVLRSHLKTHPEYRPYHCDQCGKSFTTKMYHQVHLLTHTGEKPHLCSECGKRYHSLHQLKSHMRTHTWAGQSCCSFCGKLYSAPAALTRHMRIHTGEKPYLCSQCGKRFLDGGDLQKHIRSHTGEKPYRCEVCDQRFVTSSHRIAHARIHSGVKPFTCDYCGKCFTSRNAQKKHKYIHTGGKPYKCSICPKSFTSRRDLNRHVHTHGAGLQ